MVPLNQRRGGAAASNRATKFLNRVDEHLPSLASATARREFLNKQVEAWQGRYSKFIATGGSSEPVTDRNDPPSCADFVLTIAGLAPRLKLSLT